MNRIWIELELPREKKGQPMNHDLGRQRAALATRMLNTLGDSGGQRFDWSERNLRYTYGDRMGFENLTDSGKWFNLDYLGREER